MASASAPTPEPLVYEFDGVPGTKLCVWLLEGVENARSSREALLAGTFPVDVALIDATVVPDLYPLLLAAREALLARRASALRTRSLHSELVVNLSGSRHISEALSRFGLGEASTFVLAAAFVEGEPASSDGATIAGALKGTPAASGDVASRLAAIVDVPRVTKYYKVAKTELEVGSLGDAIIARQAARDL